MEVGDRPKKGWDHAMGWPEEYQEPIHLHQQLLPFSLRTEKTWLKLPQVGVMEDRPVLENSSALGICWIKIIFYETFC